MQSTNFNELPKRGKILAASTILTNNMDPNKIQNTLLPFSNIHFPLKEDSSYGQRQPLMQNLIFATCNESSPKQVGFSKLESMAKHITSQAEETVATNSSISQNTFAKKLVFKKDSNPFASQVLTSRNLCLSSEQSDGPSTEHRRRRESVDVQTSRRGPQDSLKFLQRVPLPARPIEKKVDCESTNSGSGNQFIKPKNFDFLKRKKEEGELSPNPQIHQFQPLKKSQHIWPLAVSPMEQKPAFQPKQEEPASPTHHLKPESSLFSSVQFRKRKPAEVETKRAAFRPDSCSSPTSIGEIRQGREAEDLLPRSRGVRVQREIGLKDFELLEKLGKGAFGEVFLAQEKEAGVVCVIKKMSKRRIREARVEEHIIREIKVQSYLQHSHCTGLYGFFHDEEYLYLILECLPDGSLQQVKKRRKLPEREAAGIVRQVAEGLRYMHGESVIHRDLKPENIFMNEGHVKIGDFGCSIFHNATGLRNTIVGCLEYSSPEQLSQEGYTDKIDSWSLGILTYEILYGRSPFEADIKNMLKSGDIAHDLPEIVFPPVPAVREEAKHFILNLLQNNPGSRMDMEQVLAHPFLQR